MSEPYESRKKRMARGPVQEPHGGGPNRRKSRVAAGERTDRPYQLEMEGIPERYDTAGDNEPGDESITGTRRWQAVSLAVKAWWRRQGDYARLGLVCAAGLLIFWVFPSASGDYGWASHESRASDRTKLDVLASDNGERHPLHPWLWAWPAVTELWLARPEEVQRAPASSGQRWVVANVQNKYHEGLAETTEDSFQIVYDCQRGLAAIGRYYAFSEAEAVLYSSGLDGLRGGSPSWTPYREPHALGNPTRNFKAAQRGTLLEKAGGFVCRKVGYSWAVESPQK
ncbi:MAG TPA: hypothetical protein VHS06_03700 [Chloroflexota bacterium]|nr:hypothetical protein [Chloroflexota bacterium]